MRFINFITIKIIILVGFQARAVDSYSINSGANVKINEHDMCLTVTNSRPLGIMVPTKSQPEWKSFRDNTPNNVTKTHCCPSGYIFVPGDSAMSTSSFCVMQYEAKNSSGTAVSQAASLPWVNISKADAITQCTNLGAGYDLISNAQWQTILRNAEYVDANWSGGARGQGCLMRGNVNSESSCSYSLGSATFDSGVARNLKARHVLSNGEVIWDIGGNAYEHVKGSYSTSSPGNFVGVEPPGWGEGVISGANRLAFGPRGMYPSDGCPADDSNFWQCGLGFYAIVSSSTNIIRGGGVSDVMSDSFYTHTGYGGDATGSRGFRCVYNTP